MLIGAFIEGKQYRFVLLTEVSYSYSAITIFVLVFSAVEDIYN